jgi:hypothetical protein
MTEDEQKERWRAASARYRQRHPERRRASMRNAALWARYHITATDYDAMHKSQGGKCAICGRTNRARNLDVDHCHKTGRVRGLLCSACNRAIGCLDDSVERAIGAAKYLMSDS